MILLKAILFPTIKKVSSQLAESQIPAVVNLGISNMITSIYTQIADCFVYFSLFNAFFKGAVRPLKSALNTVSHKPLRLFVHLSL